MGMDCIAGHIPVWHVLCVRVALVTAGSSVAVHAKHLP
jgi:hypothetical protein